MYGAIENSIFLQELLSLPQEGFPELLQRAKEEGLYSGTSWTGFSRGVKTHTQAQIGASTLKLRFATILNAITRLLERSGPGGFSNGLGQDWIDASTLNVAELHEKAGTRSKTSNAQDEHLTGPDKDETERAFPITCFIRRSDQDHSSDCFRNPQMRWFSALSVAEVVEEHYTDPRLQLARYAGQIFQAQPDRLFVFALSLSVDCLHIHLFDRSGTVMTKEPININQDPETFIRVVSSFCSLSTENLGWSPIIQAWNGQTTVPSYQLPAELIKDLTSPFDIPWVMDGPETKSKYISIRSLTSLEKDPYPFDRSTLALEVVTLEDWEQKNGEAEVYVMKQSWQRRPCAVDGGGVELSNASSRHEKETIDADPETRLLLRNAEAEPFEAFVLRRTGLSENRLREASFVTANGRRVDTSTFIRHDLMQTSLPIAQSWTYERYWGDTTPTAQEEEPPVYRSLVRLFFKHAGVPIKYFRSKRDLLMGLRGAVIDHEKFYRHGVIQRDVSVNNIFLSSGTGHLIDFDHCKLSTRMVVPEPPPKHKLTMEERNFYSGFLSDRLFDTAERMYGKEAWIYLTTARRPWKSMYPHPSDRLSPGDLGWIDKLYTIPNFKDHELGPARATGTPAFISCHLKSRYRFPHTAIHDMESFWWVLVYICIKFSGPGVPKLDEASRNILGFYFSGREISQPKKEGVFVYGTELESLLNHFDPYFDDLKALIHNWHSVIKLAFEFRIGMEFNYPHGIIIHLIDEALKNINETAMAQDEDDRRRRIHEENAKAIQVQKTVHAKPVETKLMKRKKSRSNTVLSGSQSTHPDLHSPTGSPQSKKQRK
ncbi:hypothetical protein D9756_006628 [Leucocoprinus leucothites]|uniref:Fungal-type protein kinase domain-containing protein n=1 Tax=Leucocoprinus leucothites TaxID=201217 RepID=A0A8H5G281_9AGAR|nr:hypothetical protein D9756_006628 [Leucoagaricus leucothites]